VHAQRILRTELYGLCQVYVTDTGLCSSTPISKSGENFGDSRIFKADIGLSNICMFFSTLWPKWGFEGQNRGRGGAILTPNELVLPFGGSYVCANFGKNRSRNATVRVAPVGQIHCQTQTDFIICPML